MSKLGKWFRDRTMAQLRYDEMIYGVSYHTIYYRYPYNPLRYILGEVKITRIHPRAIIIGTRKSGQRVQL